MDFKAFKERVIAAAQAAGLQDYELYYAASESTEAAVFQHAVNEFSSGLSGGVCFRCLWEGEMGYAATEALTAQEAEGLVARAMDNARSLEAREPAFLCPGGQVYAAVPAAGYRLPETGEMLSIVLDTQDKLYAADPAVIDGCKSHVFRDRTQVSICNSRGLDVSYENHATGLVTVAVVSNGAEMANDFQVKVGDLATMDRAGLCAKAAAEAKAKLGGEPAPTGVWPVVFSGEAMASLLQTFASVFSADNARKNLSKLGGREGEVIAAAGVTLVDDPFCPESPMPMPFDAEGCPTRRKDVIAGGVLKTLLHNLKTASLAGVETTGNASKAGYAAPVEISPFAFYFAPGTLGEAQLLAKAGTGVYIDSLSGLHAGANPVSGDFSLQSAGFLIENGVKTAHVKSFTVAGNFYELLKAIDVLGDEVKFPMPMGSTIFGSPAVLVQGLSVAGK